MLGVAMTSADQALQIVLANVPRLGIERVPILHALGRVLAEEIHSPRDIPGFDNSAMDGYAVRAADIAAASDTHPVKLKVLGTVAAGMMPEATLTAGTAVRTMTGAPLSRGADAIVQVERTRGEGEVVEILASAERGAFVRPRGEDLRAGELVMEAGKRLTPADIGTLASLNRVMIDLYRRPRVAIVATGDELVDADRIPTGAQVVNSSAYALATGIAEAGGQATILKVARDTVEEVRERLSEALAFDLVLSTGGVSVGQFDHVKGVLDELGMRQHFHGVAQKPGRPLKFGTIGGRPVFGLPGNPVSTLVCFYLYVRPVLLKMAGGQELGLPRVEVRCAVKVRLANNLTEFVRVKLQRRDGELFALPTGNQSSGVLSSLSRADGLLIGPAGRNELLEGDQATVLLLSGDVGLDMAAFFEEPLRRQKY
ncbi:MAG TPA: gephyrin-like molybdotransferase Glp [Candidatus Binataceae bacterium]|nr:gephyrin-like molybdotransferase Glp [Candidatus Binataceae bacterium]